MISIRNPLLLTLVIGGIIGYVAACNNAKPVADANAAPKKPDATSPKSAVDEPVQLAQAPAATALATASATIGANGKQPNIIGKNHLGDRNEFLPTLHGFDEFFGYLYHLDAMQDPFNKTYPPAMKDKVGPRNLLHAWATDKDDPTVDKRWGKVGKQKIVDEGPLAPHPDMGAKYDMETIDDHILKHTTDFMEKSQKDGKPFFIWMNPTRMHVFTYLSPHYESLITPENGWSIQEAGMAQFDDIIGSVMKQLDQMGIADNTIVSTRSSGWATGLRDRPWHSSTTTSENSGALCSCRRKWPSWQRPPSSTRRCRPARASTSMR